VQIKKISLNLYLDASKKTTWPYWTAKSTWPFLTPSKSIYIWGVLSILQTRRTFTPCTIFVIFNYLSFEKKFVSSLIVFENATYIRFWKGGKLYVFIWKNIVFVYNGRFSNSRFLRGSLKFFWPGEKVMKQRNRHLPNFF
jgi:hypothetical protein